MASGGKAPKEQEAPVSSVAHVQVLAFPVNSPAGLEMLYTPFQAEHNLRTTPQPGTSSRRNPIVDVLTFLQGRPDRGLYFPRQLYPPVMLAFKGATPDADPLAMGS